VRLIFKTVREELDEMLHDARVHKKIVKKIVMTKEEFDELKAEVNYPDIEENQYGKLRLTYMGIPVESEVEDE